jgi:negative regulator of flagellin synthesis FlgM
MHVYGPAHLHGPQSINAPHGAQRPQASPPAANTQAASDQLEISDSGRIAAQLADIPDVRQDKIDSARAAIANGAYETPEKLDIALDRLLDELA